MTLRRITLGLLVLYALLTFYSIIGQPYGRLPFNTIPLIGFAFALLHAGQREGWEGGLRLVALVFGISLLFESVGVATGWVYGPYHYTDKLGPKFLDLVPYMIPIAWFMMSYPSFVIAEWLVPFRVHPSRARRWLRLLGVAAIGGLVMTAWDMVMDPMMVAGGHWVWDTQGAYFGIPLQNFLGWWVTVFTTYALYQLIQGKHRKASESGFDRQALIAYLVVGLGMVISALLNDAGNLALIGFFVMMPWVFMGLMNLTTNQAAVDVSSVKRED